MSNTQQYLGKYLVFLDSDLAEVRGGYPINVPILIEEVDSDGAVLKYYNSNARERCFVNLPQRINEGKVKIMTADEINPPTRDYSHGDWVLLKGGGNGFRPEAEVIIQIFDIDESVNPTGHFESESRFMVKSPGGWTRTRKDHIIRFATRQEIDNQISSEFRIGDRFKYIGDRLDSTFTNRNIIYTITGISGNLITANYYNGSISIDWFYGYRGAVVQFQKIGHREEICDGFAIGDVVKITQRTGDLGRISIISNTYTSNYFVVEGTDFGPYKVGQMCHATKEEAIQYYNRIQVQPIEPIFTDVKNVTNVREHIGQYLVIINEDYAVSKNMLFNHRYLIEEPMCDGTTHIDFRSINDDVVPISVITRIKEGRVKIVTDKPIKKKENLFVDQIQWKPKNKDQKLTYIQEQLVRCMLYEPESLRKYIGNSTNPGYAASFIKSLWPTRVGYEFDIKGTDQKVVDFIYQKCEVSDKFVKRTSEDKQYLWGNMDFVNPNHSNGANELRFSFSSVFQLKTLKQLTEKLNRSEVITPLKNGGLHIHVDLVKHSVGLKFNDGRAEVRASILSNKRGRELTRYRNYIYQVFDIPNKDTEEGRVIRASSKFLRYGDRAKIAILRDHNTIEWRLSDTTFNYEKIVRWTIFCHLMTETVKKPNKQFNKALFEKIMLIE